MRTEIWAVLSGCPSSCSGDHSVQCPAWAPGSVFWYLSPDTKTQTFRHIIGNTNLAVVKGGLSPVGLLRELALILTAVLVKAGQVMLNKSVLYYLYLILLYFLYFFAYFLSFYFNQQWRPLPAAGTQRVQFLWDPRAELHFPPGESLSVSQERMPSH